ncbi:MAG: hypothetical protein JNL24_04320 [Bacteroidia bacterium]|nr:hypothetical protein [Bacteroidia bacterium]
MLVFSLFICCKNSHLASSVSLSSLNPPAGTIKIGENFYLDKSSIRNIDYLEFLHWTKAVYGENSNEYKFIYPDTTFLSFSNKENKPLNGSLFTNPEFRLLDVLGVNTEQAVLFSKWRSDRVMEFLLIKHGIIKYNPNPKPDSFFTIQKYFTGQYNNTTPSAEILYYPEYRLLDSLSNTKLGFKNCCTFKKWETN